MFPVMVQIRVLDQSEIAELRFIFAPHQLALEPALMLLLHPRRHNSPPSPSPISTTPGDLLIEIALCLDSRTDLLHFCLSVRSPSTLHTSLHTGLMLFLSLHTFFLIFPRSSMNL